MDGENQLTGPVDTDSNIAKMQHIMYILAILLFIPAWLFSRNLFHTYKYAVLIINLPMFYISISAISHRIFSIPLKKEQRGDRAVIYGIIYLALQLASIGYFLINPTALMP